MKAIKDFESRNLVKVIKEPRLSLFAIPGDVISEEQFQEWVKSAENSKTLNYSEAKKRWALQKEKIQELIS